MILAFIFVNNTGIPLCTHTLNVPSYNKYWPEDGLIEPKNVTKTMYY